jgi:hypothetical protein
MNRLAAITALKDGPAMSALDEAIEAIRDHMDRWGPVMEAEERTYTQTILGTLIDLQVVSVSEAVRMGTVMANRMNEGAAA